MRDNTMLENAKNVYDKVVELANSEDRGELCFFCRTYANGLSSELIEAVGLELNLNDIKSCEPCGRCLDKWYGNVASVKRLAEPDVLNKRLGGIIDSEGKTVYVTNDCGLRPMTESERAENPDGIKMGFVPEETWNIMKEKGFITQVG